MLRAIVLSAAAAVALFGMSSGAAATVVVETTDFGNSVGTEFILPGGTTQVQGTMDDDNDGELFRFAIGTAQSVTFDLDFITGDANLLLFNGIGNPLEGDDDGGPGFDSRITIFLDAGEYLIGVGENNFAGFDAAVNEIIDNDNGNCALTGNCGDPFGILAFIANEFDPLDPGEDGPFDWVLTFSVPTSPVDAVPAPAALALFGLGLAGLGLTRSLRKTA